jgi:hypothetical protein
MASAPKVTAVAQGSLGGAFCLWDKETEPARIVRSVGRDDVDRHPRLPARGWEVHSQSHARFAEVWCAAPINTATFGSYVYNTL